MISEKLSQVMNHQIRNTLESSLFLMDRELGAGFSPAGSLPDPVAMNAA